MRLLLDSPDRVDSLLLVVRKQYSESSLRVNVSDFIRFLQEHARFVVLARALA